MDSDNPKTDLSGVVDSIMHLFGEVMSREAVFAIVENYEGDLNQSIDAIMSMSDESGQPTCSTGHTNTVNQHVAQDMDPRFTGAIPKISKSYSGVSQSKGVVSQQIENPRQTKHVTNDSSWILQTDQIVDYHNQGYRTLILLRGAPGSGKSYLARKLLESMCPGVLHRTHIFSSDDFFIIRGRYMYDKNRLSEAHCWNQNRVREAMLRGLSPIFVDNTHVKIWEMEPYVKDGVNYGYIIEILEPNTPWAKKANQLAHKNIHDVPIASIKKMLNNFEKAVSGLTLIRFCGLTYPADMKPPVMRNIPAIMPVQEPQSAQPGPSSSIKNDVLPLPGTSMQADTTLMQNQGKPTVTPSACNSSEQVVIASEDKDNGSRFITEDVTVNGITMDDLVKQLQESEKIDQEWENGENWIDGSEAITSSKSEDKPTPQPPRSNNIDKDKFLPSASNYNDWSNISMFMPAWDDYQLRKPEGLPYNTVETTTTGTSVEFGDTDVTSKNFKILIGKPKDINFYYMGLNEEKIPDKRMLDKSSMTNDHDHIATETSRCKNEEKHFAAFKKMFKNVSRVDLRDIFDRCVGDVNWAVDIVLDGVENKRLQSIANEDVSDTEDVNDEQCECLAAYNIIPSINTQPVALSVNANSAAAEIIAGPSTSKIKKDKTVLESSIQLKRQIEKNVVISDSHYSDHCLKIRKMRRGEVNYSRGDSIQDETEQSATACLPNAADTVTESTSSTDEDDSQTSYSDDCERTVNVNLGPVLVSELDKMFGRNDMEYPDNIATGVNMPISLLNEINALWMESLMYQLGQQSRQSEIMVRQDEEFARQLALKEEQLARTGQEPKVPDFKEIMDMELALSIYKKEITAEWRSNEPTDLAARMTREKLYSLFPDVLPEILSELLMAHDNNFQDTVEVLLSSTDNAQILEEEDGVAKFIAKKELERQKKILEEQKALSKVEWPLLPKEEKVDMKTVQDFRNKANQHLTQRNMYYQRAQDFYRRDMTDVATYYSEVAVMHKHKYEQANSFAAASLMQIHAANFPDNTTIDLHYLHVPEAKESLDLFIDMHIQKLREIRLKGGPRFHDLFFITGRGLHSHGGPRVKPAVKRRLRERNLIPAERNPGLLTSKVCAEDKMTYELP